MKLKYTLHIILFLLNFCFAQQLTIIYPTPEVGEGDIKVVYYNNTPYMSALEFANLYKVRTYNRKETGKIVLYFKNAKVKLATSCSFITVGNDIKHMSQPVLLAEKDFYVPVYPFLNIIKETVIPGLQFTMSATEKIFVFNKNENKTKEILGDTKTKLTDIIIQERRNGLVIRIPTQGAPISDKNMSSFFKDDIWFYLTVYGGVCDPMDLTKINPASSISKIEAIKNDASVQLSFRLTRKFISKDIHYDQRTKSILLSLNLPLNQVIKKKLAEAKTEWIIDTIVIDPGHGGKDPGTLGRWGYKHEKDIVLDVALRLGKLLEKHKDLKVVYTRKKDVFVPLWKRTEIANKSGGKLFISLHVNACATKSVSGVEFYLLRQGKSQDAIDVARAENAVIKLEAPEDKEKYAGFDNISNIIANMVHSVDMHDSESMADIFSKNFSKNVKIKNRGVKQAGFYVLVGASMPKVLVELGYNSNKSDSKRMNSKWHRQHLAETIYASIIEFKKASDQSLSGK